MSWNRRVSVVVLVLFTSLPVSRTLCAMMCAPAAAAASSHHGSGTNCADVARSSSDLQIEGASDDCRSHDAAVPRIASTAPERVELKAPATVFAPSAGHAFFRSWPLAAFAIGDVSPPGTAPRTTIPLVLRV